MKRFNFEEVKQHIRYWHIRDWEEKAKQMQIHKKAVALDNDYTKNRFDRDERGV